MLLEHFSIWVASLGVELYLAPARFAVWILLALVAGILGSWACLKIGSLWNLAYRRGVSIYILAPLCGLGLFVFVLTSTAISYVNSLVTQALRQRPERIIALSAGTRQTCLGLSAALPYLNRQMGSNFSLEPAYFTPSVAGVLTCRSPNSAIRRGSR